MKEPLFLRHLRNSAVSGDSSWADRFIAVRTPRKGAAPADDDDAPAYVLEDGKPISKEEFARMGGEGGEGGVTAEGEKQDSVTTDGKGKDGATAEGDAEQAQKGRKGKEPAACSDNASKDGKDGKRAEGTKAPTRRDSPPPLHQVLAEIGYRKKRKAAGIFGLLDNDDEVDSEEEKEMRLRRQRKRERLEKDNKRPKLPWTGKRVRPPYRDE